MDKLIKQDKSKIDKMMNTLIKKDIPRDKKIEKCDKEMKKKKLREHSSAKLPQVPFLGAFGLIVS